MLNKLWLGSEVARRILLAFLAASVIPIVVIAILVFIQVGAEIEDRSLRRIQDASRSIGQQLLDRLLVAESTLEPTLLDGSGVGAPIEAAYRQTADDITALRGNLLPVDDLRPADPERAALLIREVGQTYEVLLAKPLADGWLVGRVSPDYLWGTSNLLSFGLDLCVFERERTAALFCTSSLTQEAIRELQASIARTPEGHVSWERDGVEQWSLHWDLFLPSRFEALPWAIVVSQSTEIALDSLAAFKRVFLQAIAVSFIIVVLLSIRQIRRILEPLGQLVDGTKRIGRGDFSLRFGMGGTDEFSRLGGAMEDMAGRLGRQFATLTALAELDKLILSSGPIEKVLETLLARLAQILPGYELHVILIDSDDEVRGHLYSPTGGDAANCELRRIEIDAESRAWLGESPEGRLTQIADAGLSLASALSTIGADRVVVLPMHHDDNLRGALVGRLPSEAQGTDEALNLLREFASRIAVALSAIERERALFVQAHFDSLTGLPNRQLCYDRLSQALVRARRERHELAVLFIDLDGFKTVNDSLGHSYGDELLRETALRITAALRDTDTAARIGGDEYVVILPHVYSILEVEAVVEKLLAILRKPFVVGGQSSFVGASIGVTMFPDDGTTVEELLRKADTAMYAAKDSGRGRCAFFAADMDRRVHERLAMQTDLRNALTNGELSVVYQPQVLFGTGSLVCAEALLRWTHPVRGSVPPGVFVPILEESGLIDEVGAWVLEQALADFVRWRRAGVQIDRVAVNVATRQLFQPGFAGHVAGALSKTGLSGESLELELTEDGLVRDFRKTNDIFRELRRAGVRVAIDDFGTGYSSLVYLRELTFDVLKIDRAFVLGLPEQKSMAIVQAVLAVAHALGKKVVAEGVESELHERVLGDLGCDFAQGYLFSAPLGSEEFVAWAARRETGLPASTGSITAR